MQELKLLSKPIKLGKLKLNNRVVMTPMVTGLATFEGEVTDELIERYKRQIMGEQGAVICEPAVVLPSKSPHNLRISDESFVPGLKKLVEEVKAVSDKTKFGIQLVHFLKLSRSGWRQKVEDFTKEDIKTIVQQHVDAARRVAEAGFDFVEIHMAHAYTLASFLSSASNKRKDEYGGPKLENRMRLPIEVYEAVRDELGKKYTIGIRINGDDFVIKGNTLKHTTVIAEKFSELGVDYISVSAGSRWEDAKPPEPGNPPEPFSGYSGQRFCPPAWMPDGVNVHLAEGIREHLRDKGFKTPIITAGKIRTPELAEKILKKKKADIVGLGRALLCDPDWVKKALAGKWDEIVYCTNCMYCMEADERMEKVTCKLWPKESLNAPIPFLPKSKR